MQTPQELKAELGKSLGLPDETSLYFKREDLHPYGSHKGRSIPLMIDERIKAGGTHFAISSSGNAALAAGLHVQKINESRKDNDKIMLEILVGKNINSAKLERLEKLKDSNILISSQDRPLQALFMKTQDPSVQSLRQSNDPLALVGYGSLAEELEKIPDLNAIFIGTSSGTTGQALAEYFKDKKVEINIVQTSSCHPMTDAFLQYEGNNDKSIADAIVDTVALRKDILIPLIKKSGGNGWVASNEEIVAAQDIVKKNTSLAISANSALSVAGLMQAIYTGKKWSGAVVCLITGN